VNGRNPVSFEFGNGNSEFRAKIGIVEQEADESLYWLELLKASGIAKGKLLEELLVETDELVAIFTTIGKKSK